MIINSKDYWDWRYKNNWEDFNGSSQTLFFAKTLIGNLPSDIFLDIFNNKYSMLDFGCGKGQLCDLWLKTFHINKITGNDLSDEGISQAKKLYPNLKFKSNPLTFQDKYDICITSNTLEHLENWFYYLNLFTQIAQKYIIILVPYENEIFDEHVVSFTKDNFPNNINEFYKVFEKVINTNNTGFWNGDQYLLIYSK